jgi:D-3-phosphoglycerate dehydrogenase
MNVLIADKFPEAHVAHMRQLGCAVTLDPALDEATLPAAAARVDADVLVVRSTKVTAAVFATAPSLSLVIRAGAGVNTIDVPAASAAGVFVANCPGTNSAAVAELALGLILAADRRIPQAFAELRAGQWNKKEYSKAAGVKGRVLGIVGFGQIGQEVARRARAFDMQVFAWSRSLTPGRAAEAGVGHCASIEELLPLCDIVSIHLAQAGETKGLFNAARLALMKPGALLVNTARGGVVDTEALLAAMDERNLRAALDVYDPEPAGGAEPFDHPILKHPRFIGTPHVGASTEQAQDAVANETLAILGGYATSGAVRNCVNIETASPAKATLVVRHLDKVGVLAAVLDELSRAGLNAEEVSNTIFSGAKAAVAVIRLSAPPEEDVLKRLRGAAHVLKVDLKTHG